MNGVLPAVFAGFLLGASIFAVARMRERTVDGRLFWLAAFLAFAVAGLAAVLELFLPQIRPIYVTLMAFALSVGLAAALLGVASHLVRPVPDRWASIALAAPAVIYIVAILTGQLHYTAVVQIAILIGLTGLAAWKFEQAPRAAIWVIGAALAFAILPPMLARLAPGLGVTPQDVGHFAAGLGVLALAQAAMAPGHRSAGAA